MAHITTTDRPVYFATNLAGNIIHTGLIDTGGACGTPLAVDSDPDENTFLGKVASKAGNYAPLPAAGTWLEAGNIYGYAGGLVIVRQSHTRTEHAPADIPALFSVYRAGGGTQDWIANEPVQVGTIRTYGGKTYRCVQAHTTQTDWTPDKTPALVGRVQSKPAAGRMGGWCSVQGGGYGDVSVQTIPLPTSAYLTGGMDADCCTRIVAGGPLIHHFGATCTHTPPPYPQYPQYPQTQTAPLVGGRGRG